MISKTRLAACVLVLGGTALFAQVDTTQTQQDKPAASTQSGPSKVYYGGTVGLSYGAR